VLLANQFNKLVSRLHLNDGRYQLMAIKVMESVE
jgi:hypothetical protein